MSETADIAKGPTLAQGTVMIEGIPVLIRKLPPDPKDQKLQRITIVGGLHKGGWSMTYRGQENDVGDAIEAAVTAFALYVARR